MQDFFSELKRRNVVRVGIAYVIVAWVVLQFVEIVSDILNFPEWFAQAVLVLLIAGLPIALILSWAYEVTPEGVKKTEEVDKSKSITHSTGQKINKLIAGGLILALAFIAYDKMIATDGPVVREAEAGQVSIAVLPFVNLSDDPEQEFFSDGISEELLNVLVRVEGLQVASRTSAFAFKGQATNIQEVAQRLNVDHVLEGSVRRSGDTIRITAQLIDAKTDRHLWSETYDREFSDIFAIQDEISSAIVTALREALGMETIGEASVSVKTENLSAYEAYLKGREVFNLRSDLPDSVDLFERAVELDPCFVEAIEALAAIYSIMPSWGFADRDYYTLTTSAANKAIEMNPDLSLVYGVLGNHFSFDSLQQQIPPDWEKAFENMDRAVENDPKNPTAFLWRGMVSLTIGHFDRALADINACLAIDPLYGNCKRHKAVILYAMGDPDGAIELYEEGLEDGYSVVAVSQPFYFIYARKGERAPLIMLNRIYWQRAGFPVEDFIKAAQNPGQNHHAEYERVKKWLAEEADPPVALDDSSLWWRFVFGQYDAMEDYNYYYSYFYWWPPAGDFRKHPKFKEMARHYDLPGAWKIVGFPPQCRPIGDNDFECD